MAVSSSNRTARYLACQNFPISLSSRLARCAIFCDSSLIHQDTSLSRERISLSFAGSFRMELSSNRLVLRGADARLCVWGKASATCEPLGSHPIEPRHQDGTSVQDGSGSTWTNTFTFCFGLTTNKLKFGRRSKSPSDGRGCSCLNVRLPLGIFFFGLFRSFRRSSCWPLVFRSSDTKLVALKFITNVSE